MIEYHGFLVACLDDDGQPVTTTLATHKVFKTIAEASAYAMTVATSRLPVVISMCKPLRYEESNADMPWCDGCQSYHHATAQHITEQPK